jgi:hypothetical protein
MDHVLQSWVPLEGQALPCADGDPHGGRAMTRAKFGNVKTDGYASKREAKRAAELRVLQRLREISDLREQVMYVLIPPQRVNGLLVERACTYVADFVYVQNEKTVVEDSKGHRTRDYIIKRKLMLFMHGIRIREV